MTSRTAVLVTGATGLVGAELAARLAQSRNVIALTHRQTRVIRTDGAVLAAVDYGAASREPVSLLAADVRKPRLDLRERTLAQLAESVSCIVHCAATIDFDAPADDYRRINIDGTRHAIELAESWGVPIVHVSTAYVCGRRDGRIREDELDCGQDFSNGYERSKRDAEHLVGQARVPWAILRPAIVTGETATGRIRDYKNVYTLVKFIVEGKLRRLPGRYDATLSLVPVDYVAEAVSEATTRIIDGYESMHGTTFHLSGDATLSLRQISDVLAEYPSFEVGTFVPPATFSVDDLDTIERDYYERVGAQYTCYFDRNRTFDDTNSRQILGLRPPDTGLDYLRSLLDFCLESGYLGRPLPTVSEVLENESSWSTNRVRELS